LIELEDDALLAALPKTKVYADRAVLAQTRLVRKLWFSTLTDAYEDFAKHLESTEPRARRRAGQGLQGGRRV
jgi:hypothetical protein